MAEVIDLIESTFVLPELPEYWIALDGHVILRLDKFMV